MLRICILLLLALAPAILHADLLMKFTHHPYQDTDTGDLAEIGVRYAGYGPHLDDYTLRVSFDSTILEFVNYRYTGDPHDKRDSSHKPDLGRGWVVMSESGAPGLHGLLFTLSFRALQAGTSPLLLEMIDGDVDFQKTQPELVSDVFDDISDESSIRVVGSSKTGSDAVPEPSSVVLLGTVLVFSATKIARR